MAGESSYYTQNSINGQPGPIRFSTWNGEQGSSGMVENNLQEVQNNNNQYVPPSQYIPNQTPPQPQYQPSLPPQYTPQNVSQYVRPPPINVTGGDPNSTPLLLEHFKAKATSANANNSVGSPSPASSSGNKTNDSDLTSQPWFIVVVVVGALLVFGGLAYGLHWFTSESGTSNLGGGGMGGGMGGGGMGGGGNSGMSNLNANTLNNAGFDNSGITFGSPSILNDLEYL